MQISDHFSFEQLADFVDDRLSIEQKQAVDLHLKTGCQTCNNQAAFLQRMKFAAETADWQSPSRSAHHKAVNAFNSIHPKVKFGLPGLMRWVLPAVLALILVTVVVFSQFNVGNVYAASISSVSGSVIMRLNPDSAWTAVANGQSLPVNAEIRSGLDGMATVIFPNGDRIEISPDSNLQLINLQKENGKWNAVLSQSAGTLTIHEKNNQNNTRLFTSGGEINSHGAYFQVVIHEDGATLVNVEDGDVNVKELQEFVNVPKGQCKELPNISLTKSPNANNDPKKSSETKCPSLKNSDQPGSKQNQPFPDNQNSDNSQP